MEACVFFMNGFWYVSQLQMLRSMLIQSVPSIYVNSVQLVNSKRFIFQRQSACWIPGAHRIRASSCRGHRGIRDTTVIRMSSGNKEPSAKRAKGNDDGSSADLRPFQVMVAVTKSLGVGFNEGLPWKRIPDDMDYFRKLTTSVRDVGKRNAVIMGRKTWDGLPAKFRPLPERLNVVLTRSKEVSGVVGGGNLEGGKNGGLGMDKVIVCGSLEDALMRLGKEPYASQLETLFVIGGGEVFQQACAMECCQAIHMTKVDADFECDTFFKGMDSNEYRVWASSAPRMDRKASPIPVRYSFIIYTRAGQHEAPSLPPGTDLKHTEQQYIDLVTDIIQHGCERGDRTGTGSISHFGRQMRFDLRHSFPVLTTKKVFWRGVVEELLWFISGTTNSKSLSEKGVKIWEKHGSLEYLKSIGMEEREEGDLGPVYGFQWRHFGAKYQDMHADYSGQGIDQLAGVIKKIKENPTDRRIIMSAWNPIDLSSMALPPCHVLCQFYVANGEVSCQMYQRSGDMGLGVPFNIASYALLTCLVAHVCHLQPGDFVHTLGDAHVYLNHVDPLQEQIKNSPYPFPVLQLNSEVRDIDKITASDIKLNGYIHHKKIAMDMAV